MNIMNEKYSHCLTDCKYRELCENEFGKLQENGDDFRAIEGTHLCRLSWEDCDLDCVKKLLNNEEMFLI